MRVGYGRKQGGVNHLVSIFLSKMLVPLSAIRPIRQRIFDILLFVPLFLVCLSAVANSDARLRLMVLGDSLVAGHGLPQGEAFPDILQAGLVDLGYDVEVLNAGVSGDTTAGGLARLDWSLAEKPDALMIVLGGNDLLRGLDPVATKANLAAIIDRAISQGIVVMLAGMQAPRNLGADYAEEFDALYTQLGARHDVIFYPFFLEGVALVLEFNQHDGMHPNRAGVDEIVRRILPTVEALLAVASAD